MPALMNARNCLRRKVLRSGRASMKFFRSSAKNAHARIVLLERELKTNRRSNNSTLHVSPREASVLYAGSATSENLARLSSKTALFLSRKLRGKRQKT